MTEGQMTKADYIRAQIRKIYKASGRRRETLQARLMQWHDLNICYGYREIPCGLGTTLNRICQFRDGYSEFSPNYRKRMMARDKRITKVIKFSGWLSKFEAHRLESIIGRK